MSLRLLSRVEFAGPAGRIEGLLHRPSVPPRFLAVAAHPHPLHGGTMDNKVTWRLARGQEDAGALVLRFNFRGVGRSEGHHDAGRGERDDVRAAIAFLRSEGKGLDLPLVLSGFSFGSVMSALVAADSPPGQVAGVLLVGAPVARHAFVELGALSQPVGLVQGGRDPHGPIEALEAVVAGLGPRAQLVVIAGAGHFFDGEEPELQAAVTRLVTTGPLGLAARGAVGSAS